MTFSERPPMREWTDFYVSCSGASAALVGLLYVGLSINLKKILSIPHLPDRALEAMALLTTVLGISLLALVPGQGPSALGWEALCLGLLNWALVTRCLWRSYRSVASKFGHRYLGTYVARFLLNQAATLSFPLAGLLFLMGSPAAPYWTVPGCLFSILIAIADSWVLLIEINR